MLFGEDGLRLNIARYNIGGGNAPDVRTDYMKLGATMEGFWNAPPGTTREDMDWWDPDNPDHWNWDADANQRWWIDQIKDKVDRWEAFSNSPPWFQTVSGYVSGGFDASVDQIRADRVDEFASYLVRVTEHLEGAHGIEFDTIEPLNEPNTNFWGTQIGPDGQPTGGRQEGAHAGPGLQQQVVLALAQELAGADTDAVIAAMDETNPGLFTTNWLAYGQPARAATAQLNVHTYGTNQRTSARDAAKGSDKPLWMSEVEGSFHSPTDYTSMEPGLGIATRIVDDLRELEPAAWEFWQPVEDTIPQQQGGGNWGSIHIPFNCPPDATLQTWVAPDAALAQPGHAYRLQGVQSGRSLAPSPDATGVVIRTTDPARTDQLWSIEQLTGGLGNRERYAVVNAATGTRLAVRDNEAVLEGGSSSDPAAQWMMSTTGDGTYTLVNVATGRLVDVAGQSTGDGARVSTWTPNSGDNQRWAVVDETG